MPQISLFESERDTAPKAAEVSWEDLCQHLSTARYTECAPCKGHDCPAKYGRAWSPVRYEPGTTRDNTNVVEVTFGVFDLDGVSASQLALIAQTLDGHAYLCHQTHSGDGWRLVLPFTRPVPASHWGDVWPAIVERLQLPADAHRKDLAGIYFAPSRPVGADFQVYTGVGKAFDVDALDMLLPSGPQSALLALKAGLQRDFGTITDPHNPNNFRPSGPADLEELRTAVKAMRRPESRELLDTILGGRRLTERHATDVGHRDSEILRAVSLLACSPIGKPFPVETVMALLEPCIRSMDCAPEGLDYYLGLARDKYLRKVGERLERDARSDADKAALLRVIGADQVVEGTEDDWRKGLLVVLDRDGAPAGLRQIGANANLILEHDRDWKGTLKFNEVTKEVDVFGGPAMGFPKAVLDTEVANYLARSEYKLFLNSFAVGEQILAVARRHSYDPIRAWLESLKWDGIERVDKFFHKYLGATGFDPHIQRVSKCFLISCAARGLEPGCEVQTVPVLQGKQGCGKSRSLRALGGAWFTDTKLTLGDKDSRISAAQAWIIELSELASVRNADVDEVKAFVSQREDKIRPPYGKVQEVFLRHCVFVGTVNPDDFLTDWTGNRRWWPVTVTACDVEAVRRDRDQIFAEAVHRYRQGEQWHLSAADAAVAEKLAQEFMKRSIRAEQMVSWFARKAPQARPVEMTSYEMATEVFGVPAERIGRSVQMECGKAAAELGMVRKRKRIADRTIWVYEIPDEILKLKHNEKPETEEAPVIVEEKLP